MKIAFVLFVVLSAACFNPSARYAEDDSGTSNTDSNADIDATVNSSDGSSVDASPVDAVVNQDAGIDPSLVGLWDITTITNLQGSSCASVIIDPTVIEVTSTSVIYRHADCPAEDSEIVINSATATLIDVPAGIRLSDCDTAFYETVDEHTLGFSEGYFIVRIDTVRGGGSVCNGAYMVEGYKQ